MIDLYDFNQLNINAKATHLWDSGVFMFTRVEPEFKVVLYQLFNFYVEVYYCVENNAIQEIKSFKSIAPLSPYLDLIDITEFE